MVGDYDVEQFDAPVRDNTVSALATLQSVLGIDPSSMRLHKEDPKTTHRGCPGKSVDKADMIARVSNQLAAQHPGEHVTAAGDHAAGD